ncbi:MAG: hypothetical protein JRE71_04060 [Deltaproteobacteria bacterium]|nr:hypothetical protein [Deltaproteobacteria bacterium]
MSTILKALRKLEDEQPARASADPTQLDREVLADDAKERSRPLRRIAVVMIAVLFSGLAGAGLTLAALTFWQTRSLNPQNQSEPPAVAAAAATSQAAAANSQEERAEAPTVVVVADILEQRAARSALADARAIPAPEHYAEPAPSIVEHEPVIVKAQSEAFVRESDEPVPEPLFLVREDPVQKDPVREAPERNPIAELAAVREARLSSLPAEARSVTRVAPVAPKVAAVQSEPEQVEPEPVEWPELESVDVAPDPVLVSVTVPDPVPSFTVTRTTWHPTQQRRRVELSLLEAGETRTVELREGEFVGPFKVSKIGPSRVTFDHNGIEIERRVGAPHQ